MVLVDWLDFCPRRV